MRKLAALLNIIQQLLIRNASIANVTSASKPITFKAPTTLTSTALNPKPVPPTMLALDSRDGGALVGVDV